MSGLNPLAQALAWALIHFLWQGALLGLLLALALGAFGRRSASARYLVASLGLGLMALAPVGTFLLLWARAGAEVPPPVATQVASLALPTPDLLTRVQSGLQPWLPLVLLVWIIGACLLALRLGGGLWVVHQLKTEGIGPCPAEWHLVLSRLARALGIHRTVRLLRSSRVEVPMVAGWLRPVILLPVAAFAHLSPAQLEAILAHELAHVRRHDFLVNLLQAGIETLLFYHPAVWWLSARVREERELCCDDAAVGLCKDALDYARALALLESHRSHTPSLVLSAHGGSLMLRIRRLIQPQLLPNPRMKSLVIAGLALSALGASTYALQEKGEKQVRSYQIIDEGKQLSVKSEGEVTLQPDQKEMVKTGKDGKFRITEKRDGKSRRYEVEGDKRVYLVDGKEQALDADGEAWLRESLQDMEKMKAQSTQRHDEALKGQLEAEKARAEARRVQVQVREEGGKQHVTVTRDGKVVKDNVIDVPDVQVEEKDGQRHIIVRRQGKVEMDNIVEAPRVKVFREGDRQRVVVERDGKVVEENIIALPGLEGIPQPMVWDWDGEGDGVPRAKLMRPGSRAEVQRLKAEVEALRKQVVELQRQVGKAPKAPRPAAQPTPPAKGQ